MDFGTILKIILVSWIVLMVAMKIIQVRVSYGKLYSWYNSQDSVMKTYSCVSPSRVAYAIEIPSLIYGVGWKPYENRNTPYFLNALVDRFGDAKEMPGDGSGVPITIHDMCIGIGFRLQDWASAQTNGFMAKQNDVVSVAGRSISAWAHSNLALSMDGGKTVLDGYTVYQTYGPPMAWQVAQWRGWLSVRLRPPAYPSWPQDVSFDNNNYPVVGLNLAGYYNGPPSGTFTWGSAFVFTGDNYPYGCLLDTDGCPNGKDNCKSNTNFCQSNVSKHMLLPTMTYSGNDYTTQNFANNPFMAFGISAAAPVILRFLGYGFDDVKTSDGGTFSGGPAAYQYTQIDQFLTLTVHGGFVGYAEHDASRDQAWLENYLFGAYTYDQAGGQDKKPCAGAGAADIAASATMGGVGGAGAGAMIGSAGGPISTVVGGAIGFLVGATAGGVQKSQETKCGGSAGGGCSIM